MNKSTWVFDCEPYRRINKARREFLRELLSPQLLAHFDLKTALDVGCGVEALSSSLTGLGVKVTAFDAREENILEAKQRYPEIRFCTLDIEDLKVRGLGQFDLVICFGLLYHLENPFLAIRNLHALTGKVLIVESIISPYRIPVAALVDESPGEDQAVDYIAFIPSESAFVKMLYRAGFQYIYRAIKLPDHEEFRETLACERRRTVLVASRSNLQTPLLKRVPEPQQHLLWCKSWYYPLDSLNRLRRVVCNRLLG